MPGGATVELDLVASGNATTGDSFRSSDNNFEAILGRSATGTALSSVFFAQVDQTAAGFGDFSDRFIVTGLTTRPSEVAALTASATYTGSVIMQTRVVNGATIGSPVDIIASDSGLSLNVDFSSGAVSGTLSGSTDAALGGGTTTLTLAPTP